MAGSLKDIFEASIPVGKTALAWCNGYSGVVLKASGVTAIFDPVGVPPLPFVRADLLVVTHEHSDHWDARSLAALQRHTDALVLTTSFVGQKMEGVISPDRVKALHPGESLLLRGVRFSARPADHPGHEPLAFLVVTEGGLMLYHPSDGSPSEDVQVLGKESSPDILLYMGTMLGEGAEIARLVQPRLLVTYALQPPAAQERARAILTRGVPHAEFRALERHEVYVFP